MKRQQGIALISVLLIMFGILVVGIGTLTLTNSNLMISQNLVSHSIARTNAEAGVDAVVATLMTEVNDSGSLPRQAATPGIRLENGSIEYSLIQQPEWIDNIAIIRVEGTGPRNSRHIAEAVLQFEPGTASSIVSPYTGIIEACRSVELVGGSRADSYDSRIGNYDQDTARRNAHVTLRGPDGNVTITGYSPIWGDVYSTGSITATGSSNVLGNMHANSTIRIEASARYEGSLITTGNIELANTATITGNLAADGNISFTNGAKVLGNASSGGNISFTNSDARVDGDALARGSITFSGGAPNLRQHVRGRAVAGGAPLPNPPVAEQACDPLDLVASTAGLHDLPTDNVTLSAGRPRRNVTLTPSGVLNAGPEGWSSPVADTSFTAQRANLFGTTSAVYRIESINLLSDSNLRVSGGHVVLMVDGNADFAGNSSLHIDPDSSLTLIVSGKTTFGGSFSINSLNPVNATGRPQFSVYSLHGQNNSGSNLPTGVNVAGDVKLGATVYAPYSHVELAGSGELHGSVLAGSVRFSGSGDLHYDEALADVEIGSIGGESTAASIELLSRR